MLKAIISAILWSLSICTFILLGSIYVLLTLPFGVRPLHPLVKWVCRVLLLSCGQVLSIEGRFPSTDQGPYIYMFNHGSLLDTFIIIAVLPEFTGAIGKAEQFKVPLWGWILRRWGAVPIQRNNIETAIHSLNKVQEAIEKGQSLLIAPEGTRSQDGSLGPFKKGPFHVAKATQASIVPISILGAFRAKNRNSWLLTPGRIIAKVGDPIRQEHRNWSMEELRAETSRRIQLGLALVHK